MVVSLGALEPRKALSVNLQFTRGRYGAAARLELLDRPSGRVAVLALLGWVDLVAQARIEQTLDDLVARGAGALVVDCSRLRHIDYRMVPRLVAALERFETRAGAYALCGLSRYLRDLFRLAGCDSHLRGWPSAEEGEAAEALVTAPSEIGRPGERAS